MNIVCCQALNNPKIGFNYYPECNVMIIHIFSLGECYNIETSVFTQRSPLFRGLAQAPLPVLYGCICIARAQGILVPVRPSLLLQRDWKLVLDLKLPGGVVISQTRDCRYPTQLIYYGMSFLSSKWDRKSFKYCVVFKSLELNQTASLVSEPLF